MFGRGVRGPDGYSNDGDDAKMRTTFSLIMRLIFMSFVVLVKGRARNFSARKHRRSSAKENAKIVTMALGRLMGISRRRAAVGRLMTRMIITTWTKQRKKSFALIANKVGGCVGGLVAVVFISVCCKVGEKCCLV